MESLRLTSAAILNLEIGFNTSFQALERTMTFRKKDQLLGLLKTVTLCPLRGIHDLTLSGIQHNILYRIIAKIEKAGATSRKDAVTVEEAKLDLQERQWLNYFAGAFLGEIKKTEDKKYYI